MALNFTNQCARFGSGSHPTYEVLLAESGCGTKSFITAAMTSADSLRSPRTQVLGWARNSQANRLDADTWQWVSLVQLTRCRKLQTEELAGVIEADVLDHRTNQLFPPGNQAFLNVVSDQVAQYPAEIFMARERHEGT